MTFVGSSTKLRGVQQERQHHEDAPGGARVRLREDAGTTHRGVVHQVPASAGSAPADDPEPGGGRSVVQEAIHHRRYQAIAMVIYGTGVRLDEALWLKVEDIDGSRGSDPRAPRQRRQGTRRQADADAAELAAHLLGTGAAAQAVFILVAHDGHAADTRDRSRSAGTGRGSKLGFPSPWRPACVACTATATHLCTSRAWTCVCCRH